MATIQTGILGQMKISGIKTGNRKLFSKFISGGKQSTARYARGYSIPNFR